MAPDDYIVQTVRKKCVELGIDPERSSSLVSSNDHQAEGPRRRLSSPGVTLPVVASGPDRHL
ncbi:hypothetical protein DIPPA_18660 [Diplonema papillatum]|nr:hypothetical protein DIPPA_18660 [Diplonema papillatum]